MRVTNGWDARSSRSASSKPPSGPISNASGPGRSRPSAASGIALLAALVAEDERARGVPAGDDALQLFGLVARPGTRRMPHCSAASMALARMRSTLTRSATVRRVSTGRSRATPISVAFCTM